MRVSSLRWLALAVLLRSSSAEELSCPAGNAASDGGCVTAQSGDTVSLLQSSHVTVDLVGDAGTVGSGMKGLSMLQEEARRVEMPTVQLPKLPKLPALLSSKELAHRLRSGWSTVVVCTVLLGVCWFFCAILGYMKMHRKEQEELQARVGSVLQPQGLLEGHVQPDGVAGKMPGTPLMSHQQARMSSRSMSRMSPFSSTKSPAGMQPVGGSMQAEDAQLAHDMPPLLAPSHTPLVDEARLLVAKDDVLKAARGGDLMFYQPNGSPLFRATVRKADGEIWLELATNDQGGGSPRGPSAMVNFKKEAPPSKFSFFGPPPVGGPEIYGPDGAFYGNMVMVNGGSKLVSSTTAQTVLTVDGDMNSLQLTARTPSGLELATVNCYGTSAGGQNIDICVHRGADLALIVVSVLTSVLAPQISL